MSGLLNRKSIIIALIAVVVVVGGALGYMWLAQQQFKTAVENLSAEFAKSGNTLTYDALESNPFLSSFTIFNPKLAMANSTQNFTARKVEASGVRIADGKIAGASITVADLMLASPTNNQDASAADVIKLQLTTDFSADYTTNSYALNTTELLISEVKSGNQVISFPDPITVQKMALENLQFGLDDKGQITSARYGMVVDTFTVPLSLLQRLPALSAHKDEFKEPLVLDFAVQSTSAITPDMASGETKLNDFSLRLSNGLSITAAEAGLTMQPWVTSVDMVPTAYRAVLSGFDFAMPAYGTMPALAFKGDGQFDFTYQAETKTAEMKLGMAFEPLVNLKLNVMLSDLSFTQTADGTTTTVAKPKLQSLSLDLVAPRLLNMLGLGHSEQSPASPLMVLGGLWASPQNPNPPEVLILQNFLAGKSGISLQSNPATPVTLEEAALTAFAKPGEAARVLGLKLTATIVPDAYLPEPTATTPPVAEEPTVSDAATPDATTSAPDAATTVTPVDGAAPESTPAPDLGTTAPVTPEAVLPATTN